jgi:hypothetical protein
MGIHHAPNRQARSRTGGPIDSTDLKVRVFDIDGVRYELLLPTPKMLAVSVTASSVVIYEHAKPKDCSHFFVLRPDPI